MIKYLAIIGFVFVGCAAKQQQPAINPTCSDGVYWDDAKMDTVVEVWPLAKDERGKYQSRFWQTTAQVCQYNQLEYLITYSDDDYLLLGEAIMVGSDSLYPAHTLSARVYEIDFNGKLVHIGKEFQQMVRRDIKQDELNKMLVKIALKNKNPNEKRN